MKAAFYIYLRFPGKFGCLCVVLEHDIQIRKYSRFYVYSVGMARQHCDMCAALQMARLVVIAFPVSSAFTERLGQITGKRGNP